MARSETPGKDGWVARNEAWIRPADGATITLVRPRGTKFYALRMPNSRRPVWLDGLGEAKRLAGKA